MKKNIGVSRLLDTFLQAQINELNKRMEGLAKEYRVHMQKMLGYAALPIVNAAASRAPRSGKTHYYYKNNKKQAKFSPGHLAKSVQVLKRLKKDPNVVFVGPYVSGKISGTYGGARFNAYYAHMVEFGTKNQSAQPFMRPALDIGGPQAKKRLELIARFYLKKYEQRHGKP